MPASLTLLYNRPVCALISDVGHVRNGDWSDIQDGDQQHNRRCQQVIFTDKQNALRRECTFKIEIVLEIGVAGVHIYLKITVLTLLGVLARLAQSVRARRIVIDFHQ